MSSGPMRLPGGAVSRLHRLPFSVAAPSMVVGDDLLENVRFLADRLRHVEILLFHTPDLHNLPDEGAIEALHAWARQKNLVYSVHLPASLDVASPDPAVRESALTLAEKTCRRLMAISPEHFVLHLPVRPPVLVAEPGGYLRELEPREARQWQDRAAVALKRLAEVNDLPERLLVENINYSPRFIEPFLERELCGLCLDIGHLLLGGEDVSGLLERYLPATREIHLHGVSGGREHIALSVLPREALRRWVAMLCRRFSGTLMLEVFSETDLQTSLDCLLRALPRSGGETGQTDFGDDGC